MGILTISLDSLCFCEPVGSRRKKNTVALTTCPAAEEQCRCLAPKEKTHMVTHDGP